MSRFYFDHNATTPVLPEVREALEGAVRDCFGNASSIHREGQQARQRLEQARRTVAGALGANAAEIVFASGGTEANNLAILGVFRAIIHAGAQRGRVHIVTSAIEHPSVIEACLEAQREGAELTVVPVSASGAVSADDVRNALRPDTALVSIMHANNETGVVQPIVQIAAMVRERRDQGQAIWFHSDGVQAFGKIAGDPVGQAILSPAKVPGLKADLYTLTGHKLGAPKGIGVLWIRKGVPLDPILHGGRQERSRRPGTEDVPNAVALAKAIESIPANEAVRLAGLRDELESRVLKSVPRARVNGASAGRVTNTSNILFPGLAAESIVIALDLKGFAVSTGSACSSGSVEPSPVLLAMGLSPQDARSSVRFSLGRSNDLEQVVNLADAVVAIASQMYGAQPELKKVADYVSA
jgi:cysteine desulfurase